MDRIVLPLARGQQFSDLFNTVATGIKRADFKHAVRLALKNAGE